MRVCLERIVRNVDRESSGVSLKELENTMQQIGHGITEIGDGVDLRGA